MDKIETIEIGLITESPYQGRLLPDKIIDNNQDEGKHIEQLAENIKLNGLLTPIVVRQREKKYEIIDGHRRVRAAIIIGSGTIKCLIKDMNDREAQVMSVVGNLQREDLFAIEKALAFSKILKAGIFQDKRELSKAIGKDETYVGDLLNTLKLDKRILDDLLINKSTNDVRLLRAIRRIEETNEDGYSSKQWGLYQKYLEENLTRQEVLRLAKEDSIESAKPFEIKFKPRRIEIELNKKINIKDRKELTPLLEQKLNEFFHSLGEAVDE